MTCITPDARNHTGLDALASRFVDVDELPWKKTRFPGIEFKTLLVDSQTGLLTALLRMAAGACLPDHEHVQIEQTFVLKGRLIDDDGEVTTGNYVWRPAGSRHSAHAGEETLLLSVFLKPNRFFAGNGATTDMLGQDYDATRG